jgi:hypothetical protein
VENWAGPAPHVEHPYGYGLVETTP